jgi:transcriptional regulator with AAA-type ATPase domain
MEARHRYVLEVMTPISGAESRVALNPGEYTIGSSEGAEVRVPVEGVSRRHARLEVLPDGGAVITDLSSTNGTFVAQRKIVRAVMPVGEIVRLGPAEVRLLATRWTHMSGPAEPPAPSRERTDPGGDTDAGSSVRGMAPAERAMDVVRDVLERSTMDAHTRLLELARGWLRALPADRIEMLRSHEDDAPAVVLALGRDVPGHEDVLEVSIADATVRLWLPWKPSSRRLRYAIEAGLHAVLVLEPPDPAATDPGESELELPPPGSLDPAMLELYTHAGRIAKDDMPILITGEAGTGKEVLARWVHGRSNRSEGHFVAVHCSALPRALLEPELFGVEPGVIAGVNRRHGLVDQAQKGTLFLDDIGELAPELQARLLRLLEDRSFFRAGGNEPVAIDVRIIVAATADLAELVRAGRFRNDLYHRLTAFVADVPPLRRRRDDIPLLAAHLFHQELQRTGQRSPGIARAALAALSDAPWPGNVRQLAQEIARAVLLLDPGETLDLHHLSARVRGTSVAAIHPSRLPNLQEAVRRAEREAFRNALAACAGDPERARELLSVGPTTFHRKLKELELEK